MSKEFYMDSHEELIEEWLEDHPGATWAQAYDATGDAAYTRAFDRLADAADNARKAQKENA